MMHEQLFLNGTPIVGFGDEASEKKFYGTMIGVPLLGLIAGSIGGGLLGRRLKKGVGTAVGVVGGGLVGAAAGLGASVLALRGATAAGASTWQRLQPTSTVKSGQQLAIAIEGPNRTALTPDQISQVESMLPQIQAYKATKLIAQYPPGSSLPPDWPADDDLGPGAYRIAVEALIDSPASASTWAFPPSNIVTSEVWVRDKQ